MSTFQAVWPVVDPSVPVNELLAEAQQDLRDVAARDLIAIGAASLGVAA